jgi:replication protein O
MPSSNGSMPPFDGFSSPNYTQVPDELFDILMPQLSEAELRVLLYIIRRTFGWKKNSDDISLKQLVEGIRTKDGGFLDHGAGIGKTSAVKAVKGLVEKGIITAKRNQSTERGYEATTYSLRFRGPLVQILNKGASSNSEHALVQNLNTQETVVQETDESPSKFERSHDEPFADAGDAGRPARIALEGPEPARDALDGRPGSAMPHAAVSRLLGPENAPDGPLPDRAAAPDGSGAFRAARVAIRATLTEQMRRDETDGRQSRRLEARPSSPPTPVGPVAPPAAADASLGRRRGRPVGSSAERELVGAFLGDFNAELLHDDAALPALITQAIHIFHAGAIPLAQWPDYLYQARTLVKERAGAITKVSTRDGERKNRGPYYFAVLRDLVAVDGEARSGA